MLRRMLGGLIGRVGPINERIGRAGRVLAGLFLALMLGAICVQVISRYALGSPVSWTEEVSRTLMVWVALLVAPWAYRHGAHVSITLFADALPRRLRALMELVLAGLVIWIASVFFGESLALVERGMQARALTLPLPTGVFYTVIPVSLLALILVGVEMLARAAFVVVHGRPYADDLGDFQRAEA